MFMYEDLSNRQNKMRIGRTKRISSLNLGFELNMNLLV